MILKFATTLMMILFLVGCDTKTTTTTGAYSLPSELSECKVYYLQSSTQRDLTVMRCPNASTTTTISERQGKTTVFRNVTIIDGKPYQEITATEDVK